VTNFYIHYRVEDVLEREGTTARFEFRAAR
jgi:hypothetical protein